MGTNKKPLTRRGFMQTALVTAGTVVATTVLGKTLVGAQENKPNKIRRWAMVIDLRRCVGCEACTIACKVENNIPIDHSKQIGRKIMWQEVITTEGGEYPNAKRKFVPRPCMHCENPSCVKVCPVGATYQDKERGLVLQRYERCIGCRYCMVACPYGVRYFNWSRPRSPIYDAGAVNPQVETRYKGIVEKCTFCVHRIKEAEARAAREGRDIKDEEVQPACVQTCVGRARFFGDLNDPSSKVSQLARSGREFQLLEHLGTKPKVFYLKEA